jgi:hypothetical protein
LDDTLVGKRVGVRLARGDSTVEVGLTPVELRDD